MRSANWRLANVAIVGHWLSLNEDHRHAGLLEELQCEGV